MYYNGTNLCIINGTIPNTPTIQHYTGFIKVILHSTWPHYRVLVQCPRTGPPLQAHFSDPVQVPQYLSKSVWPPVQVPNTGPPVQCPQYRAQYRGPSAGFPAAKGVPCGCNVAVSVIGAAVILNLGII